AWRPTQGASAVRPLPSAARLADVVRGHGLAVSQPVVRGSDAQAPTGGQADAAPSAARSLRPPAPRCCACAALSLPILDLARPATRPRLVAAYAGGRVPAPAGAHERGRARSPASGVGQDSSRYSRRPVAGSS